jgi:hypothetical protein
MSTPRELRRLKVLWALSHVVVALQSANRTFPSLWRPRQTAQTWAPEELAPRKKSGLPLERRAGDAERRREVRLGEGEWLTRCRSNGRPRWLEDAASLRF